MKLFLTSSLAATCLLALPSFAFLPEAPAVATGRAGASAGANLKVQSITTVITVSVNSDGERTETTVTKLDCSGPAFDCHVNSSGGAEYVAPIEH